MGIILFEPVPKSPKPALGGLVVGAALFELVPKRPPILGGLVVVLSQPVPNRLPGLDVLVVGVTLFDLNLKRPPVLGKVAVVGAVLLALNPNLPSPCAAGSDEHTAGLRNTHAVDAPGVLRIGTVRAATRFKFVPRSGWKAWPSTADFGRTGPLHENGLERL